MTDLTSTQAYWLGHLFHASSRQLALSEYAEEQGLELASLLAWEQRLEVQGVPVPEKRIREANLGSAAQAGH